MNESQTLISTLKGSLLEGFFPKGWDLEKIDQCAGLQHDKACESKSWPPWNPCESNRSSCIDRIGWLY
jgi:hypothetical protein